MLVLALQFSKGIAGVGIVTRHRSDCTLTGHAVAGELEELMPGEREGHVVRHPQNGREDKVDRCEVEWRTNPTTCDCASTDPPVHQLGTGSNRTGRMPAND
jgi:hypothetical protein